MKQNKKSDRTFEQLKTDTINKLFIKKNVNGKIKVFRNPAVNLTLEETAIVLALIENQKKPFTKTYIRKYECDIMNKLRSELKKYDCYHFDDVFSLDKSRLNAIKTYFTKTDY